MGGHIEPTTLFASFNPSGGYKSRFFIDFSSSNFSSSDFTDESEAILLIGLLTDFRGYLAAGQWLAPEYAAIVFVTQISQMTQIFLRGSFFVPQISQIFTDFFYRISGESLSPLSGGICNDRTGRLCENQIGRAHV